MINNNEIHAVASLVLEAFNTFYYDFKQIPDLAKSAFEQRDHKKSLQLSSQRIQLYSVSIQQLGVRIKLAHSELVTEEWRWDPVEPAFQSMVSDQYSADLAMAYLHSIRRNIYAGEWRVADYASERDKYDTDELVTDHIDRYTIFGQLEVATIIEILQRENLATPYRDVRHDAGKIIERMQRNLDLDGRLTSKNLTIEMYQAGFYRNRGAYLVGRFRFGEESCRPFIIALLNSGQGIYVDALITSLTYAHNMFSSTLANFHVTNSYYHELCRFLWSIMPMRPLGLHYSTVGYNHLGKVAVMNELEAEHQQNGELMQLAPGTPGTVAIGFCMANSAYVLKVVRNTPTSNYKWGKFEGVESVLDKYTKVHEINRTDSMLDSIIYYNLRLHANWFDSELTELFLTCASESVHRDQDDLVFKNLIVQRKMTPLPIYLENASQKQAETVMVNLGYCIKNNAAANIFNRDLDARNYGVSSYHKVYLFDYDALEALTDVKIRTNKDRIDGEDDIPDWYFEDGVIFLPEELTTGLCLPYRGLRRIFAEQHQDLHTTQYWETIQQELSGGRVPVVSVYPDTERLIS